MRFPDLRSVIARKTIKSLKESTFNTVKSVMKQWGLKERAIIEELNRRVEK